MTSWSLLAFRVVLGFAMDQTLRIVLADESYLLFTGLALLSVGAVPMGAWLRRRPRRAGKGHAAIMLVLTAPETLLMTALVGFAFVAGIVAALAGGIAPGLHVGAAYLMPALTVYAWPVLVSALVFRYWWRRTIHTPPGSDQAVSDESRSWFEAEAASRQ